MDGQLRQRLLQPRNELYELRDAAGADGVYLNVTVGPVAHEATLEGDTAGLIQVAARLLELTTKEFQGAHEHFDYASCSEGSDSLIVAKWLG